MFSGRLQRLYFFRLQVGFRSSPCVSYSGTRLQGLQGGTLLANERRQASCVRLLKAPLTSCTSIPLVEAGQDQRQPVGSRFLLREATVKGRKGRRNGNRAYVSCVSWIPGARGLPELTRLSQVWFHPTELSKEIKTNKQTNKKPKKIWSQPRNV